MVTLIRSLLADQSGATAMDVVVIALLIVAVLYAAATALVPEFEHSRELIRGTFS